MLKCIKVDLPENKIVIAKSGKSNIKYVYYILKSYRNKKGQPTGKTISIGKYDEEENKLIPNDNFFEIFDCKIQVKIKGLKETKGENKCVKMI